MALPKLLKTDEQELMKWAREARSMAQANESLGANDEARKQYFTAIALRAVAKEAHAEAGEEASLVIRKSDAEQI